MSFCTFSIWLEETRLTSESSEIFVFFSKFGMNVNNNINNNNNNNNFHNN